VATLAFRIRLAGAPMIPLARIDAAVTRRTLDGKSPGGRVPERKINVEEAGKLSDMAGISLNIFAIAPSAIGDARVDMTVFDGRVVEAHPPY
jgi:hypothetical protein